MGGDYLKRIYSFILVSLNDCSSISVGSDNSGQAIEQRAAN